MILRLRMVGSLYQKIITMDRRWVNDKLLFLFIRLPPLPFERTDERRTSHAGDRILLIIPTQILSLNTVNNALALIALAPASFFSLLLWLLALTSRLLRQPARPAAGARAVSCSGACVYLLRMPLKFVSLSESLDIFRTMRLRPDEARCQFVMLLHCWNTDALWYSMEIWRCYREGKDQSRMIH